MNRRWVRRPGTAGRSSWSRCVKKNNVATFRLTQTTAIDLMVGRPPCLPNNPGVNESFGTGRGADGPDIVWERSGCSGRGLVSDAQFGLDHLEGIPQRIADRLGARALPQLNRDPGCGGTYHTLLLLCTVQSSPVLFFPGRLSGRLADRLDRFRPAQVLADNPVGQLALLIRALDLGDLVGHRRGQSAGLDLLLDGARQLQ